MNDTFTTYEEGSQHSFSIVNIFIILTGLTNIFVNCLILYGLIKTKLFRPVYIVIIHIAIFDIIGQFFCPTLYKLFTRDDDIFEDFQTHAIFGSIYFVTLYLIALLMFILLLRVQLACVDKYFIFVLSVYWVLAIIIFVLLLICYKFMFLFIPPYLVILAVLLVHLHIHQIRTTLKISEYSGVDYQVSLLIVLIFISSRLITILFVLLAELTYRFTPVLGDYYFLAILQLVPIANFLIIMKFEEGFNNNIKRIFRIRRLGGNTFRPLQEEHGLPDDLNWNRGRKLLILISNFYPYLYRLLFTIDIRFICFET
ncbi:uncharacterized protein [Onthophagus taurus]|uniref:uncharacterized protein n=1 Tax=Onthophagus taurus TaxID=166361 RepID=UPI0039BDC08F